VVSGILKNKKIQSLNSKIFRIIRDKLIVADKNSLTISKYDGKIGQIK